MTRWLVPILQERGYHFVRLDQVPGVESASRVTRQVSFRSSLDQWLTITAADNHLGLTTRNQSPGGRERFGVVPVPHGSTFGFDRRRGSGGRRGNPLAAHARCVGFVSHRDPRRSRGHVGERS